MSDSRKLALSEVKRRLVDMCSSSLWVQHSGIFHAVSLHEEDAGHPYFHFTCGKEGASSSELAYIGSIRLLRINRCRVCIACRRLVAKEGKDEAERLLEWAAEAAKPRPTG